MGQEKHLRFGFWPRYGKLMIRVRGRFYSLDAPWRRPLFSERSRLGIKVIPLGLGWRILVHTP
jgi:hypothetical protein